MEPGALGRRRRRGGAFSIARLFANGEAGGVYDPSDLTAEKVAWRRNLLTWSEDFTNAAWSASGTAIKTSASVLSFPNADGSSVFQNQTSVASAGGTSVTASVTVSGSGTIRLSATRAGGLNPFESTAVVITLTATPTRYSVTHTMLANQSGSGLLFSRTASETATSVTVHGCQLEVGPTATAYQRITDFTSDFLAAFPTHGLYQDAAGTTPVTALGQPVGLVIDSKTGGLANIGATVLTNGDFASGASWTAGTGWSIGSGVATKTAGTASVLSQAVTLTIPGTYRLVYTMTRSAGTLTPRITGGTTVNATARSASGTYTEYVTTVTGNTTFEFSADASFAGTVDNVTLQLVPGVHAIQPTSASRPLLDGRVNRVTYSEDFSNAAWTKNGSTTVTGTSVINFPNVDEAITQASTTPLPVGTVIQFSVTLSGSGTTSIGVARAAGGTYEETRLQVTLTATPTRYTVSRTIANTGHTGMIGFLTRTSFTGDTATAVTATQADLRFGFDAAYPYQRVAAATDYADVGVPRAFAFDGFDDSLYTASNMDLSGTDKVTVLAGVRKLSDAATGMLVELSAIVASNPGTFFLTAPSSNGLISYLFASSGTNVANAGSGIFAVAPDTAVATGIGNISGDICTLRRNAAVVQTTTTDQGTGNYGSYVLFIGRRNNASLPFNGKAYQLIVRGALTDAATLAQAERYVGAKTGLYI